MAAPRQHARVERASHLVFFFILMISMVGSGKFKHTRVEADTRRKVDGFVWFRIERVAQFRFPIYFPAKMGGLHLIGHSGAFMASFLCFNRHRTIFRPTPTDEYFTLEI